MALRLLAPVLVVSSLSWAQPIDFPKLTDAEKKKLEANEVVVKERKPTDNRGVSGEAMAVVDAPTTEVWPIVRDCEHYAKFLPSTKNTKRTDENGDTVCHDEIELPFPLTNLKADTKSVWREDPEGTFKREWSFVRGTYRRNRGSWTVLPWGDDKKKTLVVYFVDSDPSMLVPDFILRSAQIGTLPNVFVGVRKRVVALREAR